MMTITTEQIKTTASTIGYSLLWAACRTFVAGKQARVIFEQYWPLFRAIALTAAFMAVELWQSSRPAQVKFRVCVVAHVQQLRKEWPSYMAWHRRQWVRGQRWVVVCWRGMVGAIEWGLQCG